MKHFIKSSLLLICVGIAASALVSCDNVPEDERLIPVPRAEVARKVLIQEFTGQRCPNCPEGAAMVESLKEEYPDAIISINLHPVGPTFNRPVGGLKLTSEIATELYNYYNPTTFPAAVIDGESPLTNINSWDGAVYKETELSAPASIEFTTQFDDATRKLTVDYDVIFNETYSPEMNINIWIVENGIVGPQYTNGPRDDNYVHNHVARTTLTGTWGKSIGSLFIPDQEAAGQYSIIVNPEWVAENCDVIVFISNASSKRVEQAEQKSMIPSAADAE